MLKYTRLQNNPKLGKSVSPKRTKRCWKSFKKVLKILEKKLSEGGTGCSAPLLSCFFLFLNIIFQPVCKHFQVGIKTKFLTFGVNKNIFPISFFVFYNLNFVCLSFFFICLTNSSKFLCCYSFSAFFPANLLFNISHFYFLFSLSSPLCFSFSLFSFSFF